MISAVNSLRFAPSKTVRPVPRMPARTSSTGMVTVAAGSTARKQPAVRARARSGLFGFM